MNITTGTTFPEFAIKGGQATSWGTFEDWDTDALKGKPALLLINAGHGESNDMHNDWSLKATQENEIHVCRIIDAKDAPLGAGMFIKSQFKKAAKLEPDNAFVADERSVAAKTLGMAKKGAIVAIIDGEGQILFANHGTMTPEAQAQADEVLASL